MGRVQVKKEGDAPTQEKPTKKKVEEEANSGYAGMRAWAFATCRLSDREPLAKTVGPHQCEMLDNLRNLSI